MLCNFYNLMGMVFMWFEFIEMSEVVICNGFIIVFDEIYWDIVGKGYFYILIVLLGDKVGVVMVILFFVFKIFNFVGLYVVVIYMFKGFDLMVMSFFCVFCFGVLLFGFLGGLVVMSECVLWFLEILNIIDYNKFFIMVVFFDFKIKMIYFEGIYFCWLDFGGFFVSVGESVLKYVLDVVKVVLFFGESFIEGGVVFGWLNFVIDLEIVMEIGCCFSELWF